MDSFVVVLYPQVDTHFWFLFCYFHIIIVNVWRTTEDCLCVRCFHIRYELYSGEDEPRFCNSLEMFWFKK